MEHSKTPVNLRKGLAAVNAIKKNRPKLHSWLLIPVLAAVNALAYELFIFPNDFAPSGVGGVATMVQYVFRFDAGYLNLLINIPLLIAAWFTVKREFVLKSALFTLCFSALLVLFNHLDFSKYYYYTETGTSNVLAPVAAGTIIGFLYGHAVRLNGSTGGIDVVSAMVHRKHPEYNMVWISFGINAVIAAVSYFVYHYRFEPVICCMVYCFVSSTVANQVLKGAVSALKFEIVTDKPEELAAELMQKLHHGVTVLSAEGAYTHLHKNLVICIVNRHQIADIEQIISCFPGSFAYITQVSGTVGNFRRIK